MQAYYSKLRNHHSVLSPVRVVEQFNQTPLLVPLRGGDPPLLSSSWSRGKANACHFVKVHLLLCMSMMAALSGSELPVNLTRVRHAHLAIRKP
jgi:hypothetical protein